MATRKTYGKTVYESRLSELSELIVQQSKERALAAGFIVRDRILRGMAEPKHGLWYKLPRQSRGYKKGKSNTSVWHHASAPGEYPAIRFGGLRASVRVMAQVFELQGQLVARAMIGTNLPYGMWLETGTRRMAARPWLTLAVIETRAAVGRILTQPYRLK